MVNESSQETFDQFVKGDISNVVFNNEIMNNCSIRMSRIWTSMDIIRGWLQKKKDHGCCKNDELLNLYKCIFFVKQFIDGLKNDDDINDNKKINESSGDIIMLNSENICYALNKHYQKYKCEYCWRQFPTIVKLMLHIVEAHYTNY